MFVGAGNAVINDGTVMQGNHAEDGACICERARVIRSSGSTAVRVIGRGEGMSLHGLIRLMIQCVSVYLLNSSISYSG